MNLIIDGIEVTFRSTTNLTQTLSPLNNGVILRMSDGSGIKQVPAWGKLKTDISASGFLPDGLAGVDFDSAIVVDCIANRSITSSSNIIAIPGIVRPDVNPLAVALVGGLWESVDSSFAAGVLTIDVTAGATLYQAAWMPRLTLLCDGIDNDTDRSGALFNWSLYGEEE